MKLKNKIIYFLLISFIFLNISNVFAQCDSNKYKFHKPSIQEQKQRDEYLKTRLNLSDNQMEKIAKNREKFSLKMEDVFKKMQNTKDEIKTIYSNQSSSIQADIVSAPKKAELVILRQNAENIKSEYRKEFMEILDKDQKAEFLKLKEELKNKKQAQYSKAES